MLPVLCPPWPLGRVHPRKRPPGRRPLVAPPRLRGDRPQDSARLIGVVGERDRGGEAPGGEVAVGVVGEAGRVAQGVAERGHLPIGVVGHLGPHPVGVGDRGRQVVAGDLDHGSRPPGLDDQRGGGVLRRGIGPPGRRRRPGRAEVMRHDAALAVPLEGLLEALRPHPACRPAPRGVPGGLPGPAPALAEPHEAPIGVVAQALGPAVGVDHRGEVAPAVVHEGVAGGPPLPGDDREAVVGVGVGRHPAERRPLAHHPPRLVVDVRHRAHPVGVDHGGHQSRLDAVGDRPRGAGHPHQVALRVVGVGDLPPVARGGRRDVASLPRQGHPAPARGLDQAGDLAAGALEGDLGRTPGDRGERPGGVEAPPRRPRGYPVGEHPGPVVEVGERQLRAGLGAQHPVVAGREAHLRPVGQGDDDALARPRHEGHVEERGPPGAERPHPGGGEGVVVAGEIEQGGTGGEGEVDLGVEEVAREGAHRVVDEARGGGKAQERGG